MKTVKKGILFSLCLYVSLLLFSTNIMSVKAEEVLQQGTLTGGLQYTYYSSTSELVLTGEGSLSYSGAADLGVDIKKIKMQNCKLSGSMQFAFSGMSEVESIVFENVDTSQVTNMLGIFYQCSGLKSLDLTGIDTAKVYNMSWMFYGCSGLSSLDLRGFNTSQVTQMFSMFALCTNLSSLNVSSFDTSKVTEMYYMFSDSPNLKNLDLSSFYIKSNTATMGMFSGCQLNEIRSPYNTNGLVIPLSSEEFIFVDGNGKEVTGMCANGQSVTYRRKVDIPKITTQPVAKSVMEGSKVSFSVAATGTGLGYQWQYSKDGGKTWAMPTSAGATRATYSFTAQDAHDGFLLRCIVTSSAKQSTTSNAVKLTVKPVAPVITTQPVATSGTEGKTVNFSVVASGSKLTYQWQYSKDGGKTWATPTSSSAKKATYSFTPQYLQNGFLLRCTIKDRVGQSVKSNAVKLTVKPAPIIFIKQPDNKSVTAGSKVTFNVSTTGNKLTYQWQVSGDHGRTWINPTAGSAKTATYSFTAKDAHNGFYLRCIVKDSAGQTVNSNAVKLTVK